MRPTNVLFINSDQHSPRALGCYGNPVVQTPNLDALAARGTMFRNAYCPTPICVPSRAALATGRYPHTIGSWDNGTPYIGTEADSWGKRLTEQGHKVTTIGKLHYRRADDPNGFPDQRLPMHVLDGEGDVYGCLREAMPIRTSNREHILKAGAGEVEYTRYDRATTEEAIRFLTNEGPAQEKPWALFVSLVYPHFPLRVPQEFYDLYPPDSLPMPFHWQPDEWSQHPFQVWQRAKQGLDEPVGEAAIRTAMAAYYGMVTFLDHNIGRILAALAASGQSENTRIIYSTDHGEQLGEHGMWWKSSMLEASVGIPLIVAGPEIPEGKVSTTNVSLVDCFPGIVEAVGADLAPQDADLPGESIFRIAQQDDRERVAFSEFHAALSPSAAFMLRTSRYKYIHYVGMPPQLFDLEADRFESHDLTNDPSFAETLADCQARLRAICDPEAVDAQAKAHQQARIAAAGGVDVVVAGGNKIPYTPAPDQFEPASNEARERARAARAADPA